MSINYSWKKTTDPGKGAIFLILRDIRLCVRGYMECLVANGSLSRGGGGSVPSPEYRSGEAD